MVGDGCRTCLCGVERWSIVLPGGKRGVNRRVGNATSSSTSPLLPPTTTTSAHHTSSSSIVSVYTLLVTHFLYSQ